MGLRHRARSLYQGSVPVGEAARVPVLISQTEQVVTKNLADRVGLSPPMPKTRENRRKTRISRNPVGFCDHLCVPPARPSKDSSFEECRGASCPIGRDGEQPDHAHVEWPRRRPSGQCHTGKFFEPCDERVPGRRSLASAQAAPRISIGPPASADGAWRRIGPVGQSADALQSRRCRAQRGPRLCASP